MTCMLGCAAVPVIPWRVPVEHDPPVIVLFDLWGAAFRRNPATEISLKITAADGSPWWRAADGGLGAVVGGGAGRGARDHSTPAPRPGVELPGGPHDAPPPVPLPTSVWMMLAALAGIWLIAKLKES